MRQYNALPHNTCDKRLASLTPLAVRLYFLISRCTRTIEQLVANRKLCKGNKSIRQQKITEEIEQLVKHGLVRAEVVGEVANECR